MLLITFVLLTTHVQHHNLFEASEFATLERSINAMVDALDQACHQSSDPYQGQQLQVISRVQTGRRGRPRVEINQDFLQYALALRGPTGISKSLQSCSSRTIRRRALEHGLVDPGAPVCTEEDLPDGQVARVYTSSTRAVSTLSDPELDALLTSILQVFPDFGRRMLSGRLLAQGHNVPRERITDSYLRVHGSSGVFGNRAIHRKVYSVAGANSLWHHDGQHGTLLSLLMVYFA
jgi:hypothetical protein